MDRHLDFCCRSAQFYTKVLNLSERVDFPDRPIAELIEVLKANGIEFDRDRLPFRTNGKFRAGKYEIVGNVSSQYISGILMAASIMNEKSELKLTSSLESKNYVDMTLQVMKRIWRESKFQR